MANLRRKHTCPECGSKFHSSVTFLSEPSRENLLTSLWNHNCIECGTKPINTFYVNGDDNTITINDILGEMHPKERTIVIGSITGNWKR